MDWKTKEHNDNTIVLTAKCHSYCLQHCGFIPIIIFLTNISLRPQLQSNHKQVKTADTVSCQLTCPPKRPGSC